MIEKTTTIPAQPTPAYWTSTGLSVQAGDVVTFDTLSGSWSLNGPWQKKVNANGYDFTTYASGYKDPRVGTPTLPGAPHGMLIGQVGEGTDAQHPKAAFEVGQSSTVTTSVDGKLYLTVNDEWYADNRGKMQVKIRVEPRSGKVETLGTVTTDKHQLTLAIWDKSAEDGDKISVNLNGQAIATHFVLRNAKTFKTLTLRPGRNVLRLVVESTGSSGPCTGDFEVRDGSTVLTNSQNKTQFRGDKVGDESILNIDVIP